MASYETVIGFEAHCELLTESKLWCGCPNRFGGEPNTQTCPICLGMPGVLPVLNRKAFELAMRAALALGCRINRDSFFDRKQYYYPDLPKNYQISQNYRNLGEEGRVTFEVDGKERSVGIWNVHLEEDAGKGMHAEAAGADYSLVDLNRAGVPLLEIVTGPDLRTVAEAESFMDTLRQILLYAGVSDCKMQEGSLRFEPSISLRPAGQEGWGTRVEIKNLNSMKAVSSALEYEIERQSELLDSGGSVAQETRLWDEARGETQAMRTKEEAHDYRYMPDPDLIPVQISDDWLEKVRTSVPELPLERRRRLVRDLGLSDYDAGVLAGERETADYFEACIAAGASAKTAANWVMNDVLRECRQRSIPLTDFALSPDALAGLLAILEAGRINVPTAREVFVKMLESGRDAETIVREEGAEQVGDESALEPIAQSVLEANPRMVEDYRKGKKKVIGAIIGMVMRETKGKANPQVVRPLIERLLNE
jgi:aspartyl-tRNA(Asn)/glutamyl-tRNA(Gln) amidotransferase subunit B